MKATEVFSKTGTGNMTRESFYGLISGLVIYGLLGTAVAAYLANNSGLVMNKYIAIGLCIVPFIGVFMSASDSWFVSFIGYNIILIPFGILLGPMLKKYDPHVIERICYLTAGITFVMGLAGTIFPNVFSKMGTALFFSLCCLVFIRILGIFIPEINHLRIIDWIAAGIFSLYIGYDMYRASVVACTLDNAVDIAISLYLDVLNLFLELLKLSKSDDDGFHLHQFLFDYPLVPEALGIFFCQKIYLSVSKSDNSYNIYNLSTAKINFPKTKNLPYR